jgi:hypothetical protein
MLLSQLSGSWAIPCNMCTLMGHHVGTALADGILCIQLPI